MRAAFAILILELLIQLPGPNQWKPVALASPFAIEASVEAVDHPDFHLVDTFADGDDQVIFVQLFEDDVVHEDVLVDHHRVMASPPRLSTAPPDEPHLERDNPPPQARA